MGRKVKSNGNKDGHDEEGILDLEDGKYLYCTYDTSDFSDVSSASQCLGFILDSSNNILLTSQGDDFWELPGGTIEANENPEDALIREVYEETACVVDPKSIAPFYFTKIYKIPRRTSPIYHTTQLRYVARSTRVDTFVKDPGGNHIMRKFVPLETFDREFSWKSSGREIKKRLTKFLETYDQ